MSTSPRDRAARVARPRVGDDGFEAVAGFDAVFAFVRSHQQENAGVLFFCADAEVFEKIRGVIFDGAIVERTNGDDGELCAGLPVKLGAERFEALTRGGGNDSGEIGDVAVGDDFGNVVGKGRNSRQQQD